MRDQQEKDQGQQAGEDAGITLIVGGTGKTGRRVARLLEGRGVPVRSVSRSSELPFDWEDASSWEPALRGASAAYVTYSPDLAVPEAPERIRAFARLAAREGVERLVLLSGRGEEEAQRCEAIVQEINPAWTVVRASWFSQNFSEAFFLEPLQQGVLALPAGEVREPFVDAEDIAEVVVAALTEPGHEGEIYEVTGPRLLSFSEAVAEIATAAGRELAFVQVPSKEYVAGMREQGVPEEVIGLTQYLFETVLDGRNSKTTDGIQRALGRAPRDFADYAREVAATGLWDEVGAKQYGQAENGSGVDEGKQGVANEQVMRGFIDQVLNGKDASAIPSFVHEDYVYRSPAHELRGLDGLSALLGGYWAAFPDLAIEVEDLQSFGDSTLLSFTLRGTHRGEFLGHAATQRTVRIHGMLRTRFRDGKIVEDWEILDQLGMFEQLGLIQNAS